MGGGKGEDAEALVEIGFEPGGEFWGGGGAGGDEFLEAALGAGTVCAVEDAADVGGDLGAHFQARDAGLGVLLEMELAALPGDGWEDGAARGGEAGMAVGTFFIEEFAARIGGVEDD